MLIPAPRQVVDEQIDAVVSLQREIRAAALDGGGPGVVDGLWMGGDLLADAAQGGRLVVGDATRGSGADVEEIIGADFAAGAEVADDFGW